MRISLLPGDVAFRIADLLASPREALRLFLALGLHGRGGAALRRCFAEALTLQRAARQRHDEDGEIFARWDRLPFPLQGVIANLQAHLLRRVFRGAAAAGVAALSRVDCARPRVDRARKDVDARALERRFQRETAAIPAELRELMLAAVSESIAGKKGRVRDIFDLLSLAQIELVFHDS